MGCFLHPVTTLQDCETVAAFAREIWTEHYTPLLQAGQIDYMLDLFQSSAAIAHELENGTQYRLFPSLTAPEGYVAYTHHADHLWLSKLYICKDARRKGWARRVVESLSQQAATLPIRLRVYRKNTESLQAYQRLGFHVTGTLVTDIGQGFVMDDVLLERPPERHRHATELCGHTAPPDAGRD